MRWPLQTSRVVTALMVGSVIVVCLAIWWWMHRSPVQLRASSLDGVRDSSHQPQSMFNLKNFAIDTSTMEGQVIAELAGRLTPVTRDNLFISGYIAASDPRVKLLGITHILKLYPDTAIVKEDPTTREILYSDGYIKHLDIQYLTVPCHDTPTDTILHEHLHECLQFIDYARQNGGKVLVHCHMGVSRSATVVLLYMMTHNLSGELYPAPSLGVFPRLLSSHSTPCDGMTLSYALKTLRALRPEVNPNSGFMEMLRGYDGVSL